MMQRIKQLFGKNGKIMGDLVYTIAASFMMNAVLQLAVYPLIGRHAGSEVLGNAVYYMGVVFIIGQPIGMAFCSNRLRLRQHTLANNGDYLAILAWFTAFAVAAAAVFASLYFLVPDIFLFILLVVTLIFRYYATLEFRLHLNYKGFFLFNVILSLGYLLGVLFFYLTGKWQLVFITGEAAGILYVLARGSVFRWEKRTRKYDSIIVRSMVALVLSYLLNDVITNSDKLIIRNLLDAHSVSVIYVVSMMGKVIAMFVGPINNVTVSHLSSKKSTLTRAQFFKLAALYVGGGALFYLFCVVATPIFARIFYPDIAPQIGNLNLIVNAGQIFNFVSSLILMLLFVPLGSKNNLVLQIAFAVVYLPLALLMTANTGLAGFANAFLIANILRLAMMLLVGFLRLPKVAPPEEENI